MQHLGHIVSIKDLQTNPGKLSFEMLASPNIKKLLGSLAFMGY